MGSHGLMVTPYLGLDEIEQSDPLASLYANTSILVQEWQDAPRVESDALTAPPVSVSRGQAWILGGTGTGDWSSFAANDLVIALDDNPTKRGWHGWSPREGQRVYVIAGTNTGHRVWNGTSYALI